MISSSLGGMSGFNLTAGTGARFRMDSKITPLVSPRNGRVPVHISYRTAPNENKSVRTSSSLPRTDRKKVGSDWSSDVCSSDLLEDHAAGVASKWQGTRAHLI